MIFHCLSHCHIWKVSTAEAEQEDTNKATKYRAKHFLGGGKKLPPQFYMGKKINVHCFSNPESYLSPQNFSIVIATKIAGFLQAF